MSPSQNPRAAPRKLQSLSKLTRSLGILALAFGPFSSAPLLGEEPARDPGPAPARITTAVESGLNVLRKGTFNFAKERNCFTCHHQTLPMLAQVTARKHGFKIDENLLREQARFTHEAFAERKPTLRKGAGIGGRSMTVAYGLWALDLADWNPLETTEAMATYLKKTQEENGRFFANKNRPPLEDSPVTGTFLAAYYLDKFAGEDEREDAAAAVRKAADWLLAFKPVRLEDWNFRLWGCSALELGAPQIEASRKAVLAAQRPNGGWAQLPAMEPDAYATGQSLWILQETGFPTNSPEYRMGVRYLLETQRDDGSWLVKTRSKPIQKYFESGFPHGVDQFISICGTSWAVAALAATQPAPTPPPR